MGKTKFLKHFKIIIISILFALASEQAFACSFGFSTYYYTPEDINIYYPLQSIEDFLDSEYGIILSKWGPKYLYPVYMDLVGKKISPEITKKLLAYYDPKIGESPLFARSYLDDAVDQWVKSRKLISNTDSAEIGKYKRIGYSYFINCLPDAFVIASKTLKNRMKIYSEEELEIWLRGQDAVFATCTDDSIQFPDMTIKEKRLLKAKGLFSKIGNFFSKIVNKIFRKPEYLKNTVDISKLLQQDREYQEAAINFYKGNLNETEQRFKKIFEDLNHPWRDYAALVLGRTYIRKAYFEYEEAMRQKGAYKIQDILEQERNKNLAIAQTQFENILKDSSLSAMHKGARDLLNYVNYRIDPKTRLKYAEDALLSSSDPDEIIKNLEDFSLLWYDKIYWKAHRDKIDDEYKEYEKFILEQGGDFMQWLYAWLDPMQNSLDFALQKYQQTKSMPWLLASLKLITPEHPMQQKIIQEAEKISKNSSAYLSAQYYGLKFLISAGEIKITRQEIDRLLKEINFDKIRFAKNYFIDLRMLSSENFTKSLKYSLRELVAIRYGDKPDYYREKKIFIDNKIKQLFNEALSSDQWIDIALSVNELFEEKNIKQQVLLTTFARSILLDNLGAADKIAQILADYNKTLKDDLSDFILTTDNDEKKFLAVLFILRYPKLNYILDKRIERSMAWDDTLSFKNKDPYKDNWWCFYPSKYSHKSYNINNLKNLTQNETQKVKTENNKIYNIIAPNYLTDIVNNYALNNRDDNRVPEALHLAIMSARYIYSSCKNDETSEFTKQAFEILHNNYPDNYWTNKTPYWYK